MRIVHLIDQFGYCDGCARHVFFLAREQKRAGHEVRIVAGKSDASELLERENIFHEVLSSIHHANRSVLNMISGAMHLRRHFIEFRPDIVHAHHFYAASQARLALFFKQRALVQTVHSNLPSVGWLPKYIGLKIIAVSESTRENIRKQKKSIEERIEVIPNSSGFIGDEEIIRTTQQFLMLVRKGVDCFVVTYIGRLVREKGIHVLIRALAEFSKHATCVCLIVGEGEQEHALRDQAAKLSIDAIFFGTISDVKPLLELSDVVVIPSLALEGLPMTLMEAGLVRKAVIASRTDGIPEIIEHGVSGWLVQPNDVIDLANALRTLHSDAVLRKNIGDALYARVQPHTIEHMAERVEEVYRTVLRRMNG